MYSKTFQPKEAQIERKWYRMDATDQVLGRFAVKIARILQGKQKPIYAGQADVGDFVVVTNAKKIMVTGKNLLLKTYFRHSGYPGGDTTETLGALMSRKPEEVIIHAVKGMLPKNKLRAKCLKRLKVFAGAEHSHGAQQPETI